LHGHTQIHPITNFVLFIVYASDVYKSGETAVNNDSFDITKTGYGRHTTTATKDGVTEKNGETKEF
jgi:hypothetical protein